MAARARDSSEAVTASTPKTSADSDSSSTSSRSVGRSPAPSTSKEQHFETAGMMEAACRLTYFADSPLQDGKCPEIEEPLFVVRQYDIAPLSLAETMPGMKLIDPTANAWDGGSVLCVEITEFAVTRRDGTPDSDGTDSPHALWMVAANLTLAQAGIDKLSLFFAAEHSMAEWPDVRATLQCPVCRRMHAVGAKDLTMFVQIVQQMTLTRGILTRPIVRLVHHACRKHLLGANSNMHLPDRTGKPVRVSLHDGIDAMMQAGQVRVHAQAQANRGGESFGLPFVDDGPMVDDAFMRFAVGTRHALLAALMKNHQEVFGIAVQELGLGKTKPMSKKTAAATGMSPFLTYEHIPANSGLRCAQCKGNTGPGGSKLRRCSACRFEFYCTPECQKAHWKAHKQKCREAVRQRQADVAMRERGEAASRSMLSAADNIGWHRDDSECQTR